MKSYFSEHYQILLFTLRWTAILLPIAIAIGSTIAFFLWILGAAIHFQITHPWMLFLLPFSGILIHFIYQSVGKSSEKGNNLIMEEIHKPGGGVPAAMAPVILFTTVITHLFGGSAGREGTAVQIGGSIAQFFGNWFKLDQTDTQLVLTAGIAAGFGAVFGTPLTGAVFALEVLAIGGMQYNALFPALIAAIIGDYTVAAWGVHHTAYHIDAIADTPYFLSAYLPFDILLMIKIIVASVAFGLASYLFSGLVHEIKAVFLKLFKIRWMIPFAGGLILIALTFILGKTDYLSLGVEPEHIGAVTIPSSFQAGGATTWSWFWKLIYTTLTLGTGFKGGEVTPLFYIGSTLGNTLSGLFNAPVGLFAALGFIAVFAGATNTPLACTFMGIELFGGQHVLLYAIACFTAYLFSGNSGIYSAQQIANPKVSGTFFSAEASLAEANTRRGHLYQKLSKYKFSTKPKNNL